MSTTLLPAAPVVEPAGNEPAAERADPLAAGIARGAGLLGLGPAGLHAALALRAAGHRLLVCDPDAERCRAYAERAGPDADLTDDPAELGARCGLVLLVQDLGQDDASLHGRLITRMAAGTLIVDMGPALPAGLRDLAAGLAPQGLRLMDAVLLAGDPALVLAGGQAADLAIATPVLGALGTVLATGPVGSARAIAALRAELETPLTVPALQALIQRSAD